MTNFNSKQSFLLLCSFLVFALVYSVKMDCSYNFKGVYFVKLISATPLMLVFLEDLKFGFKVYTKKIKHYIVCHACIICVKFLLFQ